MYAFYKKHEYLLIALFVLISQLAVLPELGDWYPDTDNYTHARRVLDFLQSKNWAETPYMHSNYPFGEVLHFTRITDLFWLFFSLPAFLFFPLKEAVFWGGYIFQTGVLALSAVALVWGLRPAVGPIVRLIAVCLLFVQPSVTETYILIKPDHHALTAFFCFVTAGGLARFLFTDDEKDLRIAGVAAALGLWTSIEGILICYGLLTGLAALFMAGKVSARACAVFCFYYFTAALLCLAVNPPFEGFFNPDNGRLSFLTVVVAGFTAAAMILLSLMQDKGMLGSFWRRAGALAFLTGAFAGLLLLCFTPAVVFAPHFPPIIKGIWADNIVELQPSVRDWVRFFLGSAPSLLVFVIGIALLPFCPARKRAMLVTVLPPLLFLTLLSMKSIRYARLSSLFTPYILAVAFSLRADKTPRSDKVKGAFLAAVYILFAAYLAAHYISVNRMMALRRPPIDTVAPYLPDREGAVLSDTSSGPEIIWKLDEPVVGTPYHRNIEGIVDDHFMLYSLDMDESVALMKKHRIKAILVFLEVDAEPDLFYNMNKRYTFFKKARNDGLLTRLMSGKDLPCGITEDFNTPPPYTMFKVDFSKCGDAAEK